MARPRVQPRCCFCFALLPPVIEADSREVLEVAIVGLAAGSRVLLRWCMPCAEADPMHLDLAAALGLPDGEDGDLEVARAHIALVDRIAEQRGANGLRACVDVRRDNDDPRVTLRGDGLEWGRLSARRITQARRHPAPRR
jgi:hypothetical protein